MYHSPQKIIGGGVEPPPPSILETKKPNRDYETKGIPFTDKAFKGTTIVDWALTSFHGDSLEIKLTISLIKVKFKGTAHRILNVC